MLGLEAVRKVLLGVVAAVACGEMEVGMLPLVVVHEAWREYGDRYENAGVGYEYEDICGEIAS